MSKATVRQLAFQIETDPDTGTRVTRLTPEDVTCHRNYFYQKCFTNDGRRLIFGAEFGPGPDWHYHLLDLDSQTALQLTDQPGENTFGGFLSPDDRHLYFVRQQRNFVRLELATLREEVVYVVPEGWVGYGTWVANSACTKVVGIEIAAEDWFALSDWQKFNEMFERQPRCRLFSIDLATGARQVILEQKGWLGHPQYRPFDDRTVAYCHEGPHDRIDARMWFIDEDGTNRRCGKPHENGESCTHEFWVPDGSAMIYVSYLKDSPERWIRSLDPVTLADRPLTQMPPCSHLMSNHDGTLIVGDGCGHAAAGNNEMLTGDPYLHLFDLKAGTTRRLARHDSSWGVYKGDRQVTHPHPSFTPDDRQVLFSCDKRGEPGLFLVDLA
ncbi:Oligogalacturonide lyase [Sphaerotilus natans subsp. natans DSM 6575]|uniref:Oligogalacturonide lyase n=1 Tax=Sphaerotilus natans subsp. natans DSM 6575 TaxID=1286631 RepID=A0A059KIR7_9BURK|nr:oligogalacturonate lyase family protein [Sphaerotilus natans]KDB50988.1 Oligogalacturonide lyase [Sphaerotilus natans subsp. natans DSM 6575]SIR06459.1 oligogalacturonide lyase [Sphaerotilus natans]